METKPLLDNLTPDATLSQITSAHWRVNKLLASIGLEPSRHGSETLRALCQQRQWNETEVMHWIRKKTDVNPEEPGVNIRTLEEWCEYVSEGLHPLNVNLLNEIAGTFPRVVKVHGNQYPQLKHMREYFKIFNKDLRRYIIYEGNKFFPLAEKLGEAGPNFVTEISRKLERAIMDIEEAQQRLMQLMDILREKGRQFENPKGACSTYRILNQDFKLLDKQLKKQFNVEKEMIIPLIQQKLASG